MKNNVYSRIRSMFIACCLEITLTRLDYSHDPILKMFIYTFNKSLLQFFHSSALFLSFMKKCLAQKLLDIFPGYSLGRLLTKLCNAWHACLYYCHESHFI